MEKYTCETCGNNGTDVCPSCCNYQGGYPDRWKPKKEQTMSLWSETMRLRDMYCDVKKQLIEATSTNIKKDLKSLDKEYLEIGRICDAAYMEEHPLRTFEDLDYAERLEVLSYK